MVGMVNFVMCVCVCVCVCLLSMHAKALSHVQLFVWLYEP